MKNKLVITLLFAICILCNDKSLGQLFSKSNVSGNPIHVDAGGTYYNGAAWIDYDNDGKQDLLVVKVGLYHNDGNGQFTKVTGSGLNLSSGLGTTWADVDNDGDIDAMIIGGNARGSSLYINNGNGTFSKKTTGDISDSLNLKGWTGCFGDYDNDGLVDLIIAAPLGYIGITDGNKLLHNTSAGNFIFDNNSDVVLQSAPYTVPSFYDYDNDGDIDLFIGTGPVTTAAKDSLFQNNLFPSGSFSFSSTVPSPLSSDVRDGQNWNWIDFDNDGDLDGYVSNLIGTSANQDGWPNDFYRNDNGIFVKMTAADVGPIVGDTSVSLSNIWQDFDNDGDLDCIVVNDNNQSTAYYQNNWNSGSTVFTKINNEPFEITGVSGWTAVSGDYDNDGDMDLFISAQDGTLKGIYDNMTTQTDFINIKFIGVSSNNSGLGVKVRVKARGFWQMREISAQNSFNGMNMLNAHFGFGATGPLALIIDSIEIKWPSGIVDICTNVYANYFYEATEGQCMTFTGVNEVDKGNTFLLSVYPNPATDLLTFKYNANGVGKAEVSILDETARLISRNIIQSGKHGIYTSTVDIKTLSKGIYTLKVRIGDKSSALKFIKQ